MEDLIRVGVADSAEKVRISQRTLESVALAREKRAKCLDIDFENFRATRIESAHRCLSAHQMERCSSLRSRLRQKQRAVREVEGRQPQLPRNFCARRKPAKAAGDHQVDDDEKRVIQLDDDALADATNVE